MSERERECVRESEGKEREGGRERETEILISLVVVLVGGLIELIDIDLSLSSYWWSDRSNELILIFRRCRHRLSD